MQLSTLTTDACKKCLNIERRSHDTEKNVQITRAESALLYLNVATWLARQSCIQEMDSEIQKKGVQINLISCSQPKLKALQARYKDDPAKMNESAYSHLTSHCWMVTVRNIYVSWLAQRNNHGGLHTLRRTWTYPYDIHTQQNILQIHPCVSTVVAHPPWMGDTNMSPCG